MTYTSKGDVKAHLGITDNSYDKIIDELVFDADEEIHTYLDIDGFLAGSATQEVRYKRIIVKPSGYYQFRLKNPNVTSITAINGTSYTGTKGIEDDYYIKSGNVVLIGDLQNYTTNSNFDVIEVTYSYGYSVDNIPKKLRLASTLWVATNFRDKYPLYGLNNETPQTGSLSSYQLGDETIKFSKELNDRREQQSQDNKKMLKILDSYRRYRCF